MLNFRASKPRERGDLSPRGPPGSAPASVLVPSAKKHRVHRHMLMKSFYVRPERKQSNVLKIQ